VVIKHELFSQVEDKDFGLKLKVTGICSVNREEWILTDLATNLLGVTSVPLYETLGHQMLILILQQTEMTTIFGNIKSLTNILGMTVNEDVFIETFVSFDPVSD